MHVWNIYILVDISIYLYVLTFIFSSSLIEEDEDDEDDLDNLIGRFQRVTLDDNAICLQNLEQNVSETHHTKLCLLQRMCARLYWCQLSLFLAWQWQKYQNILY